MKNLILLILCISSLTVMAQTEFHDEPEFGRTSFPEIIKAYPASISDTILTRKFSALLDTTYLQVFGKRPARGFATWAIICVNKSGSVDHVIFHELGDLAKMDSVERMSIKAKIRAGVGAACERLGTAPRKANFSFQVHHYFGMPRREKHTGDSLLTDLKQLSEFKDSLKIKKIYLDHLELKAVPLTIYRFTNLEELFINSNMITSVSIDFARLPKLKQLHANQNLVTTDSLFLTKNKSLQVLNLNQNKFDDIPRAVRNCKKLNSVWLAANDLKGLSASGLKRAKQIRDLNLYQTKIRTVPSALKKLRRLEVLDLYHNNLTEVPASVIRLKKLTHLAISHNQIKVLPEKLYKLKRVHTLYAHHNWLTSLPKGMDKMQQIEVLDLGYNWFAKFPPQIIALVNLRELDLSSNYLTEFPAEVLDVRHVEKLFLRGNPFLKNGDAYKEFATQLGALKMKNVEVFY